MHDPSYDEIVKLEQVPSYTLDEIRQFFDTYKEYDDGSDGRTDHFDDRDIAIEVVGETRKRQRKTR